MSDFLQAMQRSQTGVECRRDHLGYGWLWRCRVVIGVVRPVALSTDQISRAWSLLLTVRQ